MRAGGAAAYVAVDAEAMGELALRLERAADELQLAWRAIGTTASQWCLPSPCAVGVARAVEDEVREAASSVRRRHADVVGRCLVDPPGALSWRVQLAKATPSESGGWKAWAHGALDAAGMVPLAGEVFDVVNGAWYALDGEWADAALSMAALVPVGGQLASGSRYLDDAADAGRTIASQGKHAAVLRRGNVTIDDLAAMEGRRRGHAIREHVGKTLEELTDRQLRTGLDVVSTFHSADDLAIAVNKVLSELSDEVAAFLDGTATRLPFVVPAPGLGSVLAGGRLLPSTHAKVVLKRLPDDVIVVTAMVERVV